MASETGEYFNLLNEYIKVRKTTERLCLPLIAEDYVIQSTPEVSPPKWHLAHTSWFFENFILIPFYKNYSPFHEDFGFLFNSYYQTVGTFLSRPLRGILARPSVEEIYRYRSHVDQAIAEFFSRFENDETIRIAKERLELGIHHEQQHQELLLTDIKMNFWSNPIRPIYEARKIVATAESASSSHCQWIPFSEGIYQLGKNGPDFAFDNEGPVHPVFLGAFKLASRLVTNGEFLEFIEAKGYESAQYWLSDGWTAVQKYSWVAPLYWEKQDGNWNMMTFFGMQPLNPHEPVCHISYYEADAFARWSNKRLPTEAEWETAAKSVDQGGNFLESNNLRPLSINTIKNRSTSSLFQLYGDVWEWTRSSYLPYPGFRSLEGAIGEYNGKFMCNQMVLRGGSFGTPVTHIRSTYRNFFSPETRWQFTGLRFAEEV